MADRKFLKRLESLARRCKDVLRRRRHPEFSKFHWFALDNPGVISINFYAQLDPLLAEVENRYRSLEEARMVPMDVIETFPLELKRAMVAVRLYYEIAWLKQEYGESLVFCVSEVLNAPLDGSLSRSLVADVASTLALVRPIKEGIIIQDMGEVHEVVRAVFMRLAENCHHPQGEELYQFIGDRLFSGYTISQVIAINA